MIREKIKWCQFHARTQRDLDSLTKRHYNCYKLMFKTQTIRLFIKHRSTGSAQGKWYLLQVYMDQSDPVIMIYYGVYQCRWYIRHHKYCTKLPIMECCFRPEIRKMQQDGTLGKMWPVRLLLVHYFLKKLQSYVWYQDDISLADHRLFGPFQFGTTRRKKLKYPNMIDNKQWNEFDKE